MTTSNRLKTILFNRITMNQSIRVIMSISLAIASPCRVMITVFTDATIIVIPTVVIERLVTRDNFRKTPLHRDRHRTMNRLWFGPFQISPVEYFKQMGTGCFWAKENRQGPFVCDRINKKISTMHLFCGDRRDVGECTFIGTRSYNERTVSIN